MAVSSGAEGYSAAIRARREGELVGVREALAEAAEAQSTELSTDLAAERAKAEKAIEAFAALAERDDLSPRVDGS